MNCGNLNIRSACRTASATSWRRPAVRMAERCSTQHLPAAIRPWAAGKSGISAGGAASYVSLDEHHPSIAGKSGDAILDAWIFANGTNVDSVWIGGRKLVSGGRHIRREAIVQRFRKTMIELASA